MPGVTPADSIEELVGNVMAASVRRVHVLAWRDLDDPDAGGSELHADQFMRRWAAAGLDIVHRTSAAVGLPPTARRHDYDVVRRGSRYTVFPRAIAAELARLGADRVLPAHYQRSLTASSIYRLLAARGRLTIPLRISANARYRARESSSTAPPLGVRASARLSEIEGLER